MNKSIIFSKIAILLIFIMSANAIFANGSKLYIKNGSSWWDIKIKFAAPNSNGTESTINAGKSYFVGDINNMYDIANLSVKRAGYGEGMSSFVALNVQDLREKSVAKLKNTPIPAGYVMDVYWEVQPSGTSWTAVPTYISRLNR